MLANIRSDAEFGSAEFDTGKSGTACNSSRLHQRACAGGQQLMSFEAGRAGGRTHGYRSAAMSSAEIAPEQFTIFLFGSKIDPSQCSCSRETGLDEQRVL